MRYLFLVLPLVLASCASSRADSNASACPAERAIYTLRGAPDATLRIIRVPHAPNAYSDMAARVDYQGDTYWFAFSSSLGYSRNYVGRIPDPIESARREDAGEDVGEEHQEPEYEGSEYTAFDADFDVIENVPQSGDPAPAHLLAIGISSSIWYSIPRRELPKALWDFSACAEDSGAPDHEH